MSFWLSPRVLVFLTALVWWVAGAFQIFPLGWVALAPFFLLIYGRTEKERFKWGYCCGVTCFALINWWLIPTIARGGAAIGASAALSLVLGLGAVAVIALIHGLQMGLVALLCKGKSKWLPLQMAFAWVALDWLRCQTILAHSWGNLAVSQTSDWPILMFGQHFLTFVCALVAFCVGFDCKARRILTLPLGVGTLAAIHIVGFSAQAPESGFPGSAGLKVLSVQTAASSLIKSGAASGEPPLVQAYRQTLLQAIQGDFDLVIWPETTLQLTRNEEKYGGVNWVVLNDLRRKLPQKTALLFGASVDDENGRRWNEAILWTGDGKIQSYTKRRLVPFGERAPFSEIMPFLGNFAPRPPIERGEKNQILRLDNASYIYPRICFESCFPGAQLELSKVDSSTVNLGFLDVVITNDEWFAGTEVARQHRAMAQLRAAEGRRALVQSANGGYSFFIDRRGRLLSTTPFGVAQSLAATVATR